MSDARPRIWLRRIGWIVLGLFVLLAIFHRPIFFEGTRYFMVRVAKQQKLDINYDIEGSIFTSLRVKNFVATPLEQGPVRRLEIKALYLRYSLLDLVRDGVSAFLKELEMHDVYVDLIPEVKLTPEKREEPQEFKFPALFPERLVISNVNLLIEKDDKKTRVRNMHLTLLPDAPGALKVEHLNIPGIIEWDDIIAATTYADRKFRLMDLEVAQGVDMKQFVLDMSELNKKELGLELSAVIFGGPVIINLHITDLNASNRMTAVMEASEIEYGPIAALLNLPAGFAGGLDEMNLRFEGEPMASGTWNLQVESRLRGVVLQGQNIGAVQLSAQVEDGKGNLHFRTPGSVAARLEIESEFDLPQDTADLNQLSSTSKISLAIPDLGILPVDGLRGEVRANGTVRTAAGVATGNNRVEGTGIGFGEIGLSDLAVSTEFTKTLQQPEGATIYSGLSTSFQGSIGQVIYKSYAADNVRMAGGSEERRIRLESLVFERGDNRAEISGEYLAPAEEQEWSTQPYSVRFAIAAPDLSEFVADQSTVDLRGTLNAKGSLSQADGARSGTAEVRGAEISVNGLPIRSIAADIALDQDRLRADPFDVVFDDRNAISGKISAVRDEGFVYNGEVEARLGDISIFRPLLGEPENRPELAGSLLVIWEGDGNLRTGNHTGFVNTHLENGRFGELRDLELHFSAELAPDYINLPDLYFSSQHGRATLSLFWQNEVLRGSNLIFRHQGRELVSGSFSIPLDLERITDRQNMIPPDEPISADLVTRSLPLEFVFGLLQQSPPPATGNISLELKAAGTLNAPAATLQVEGANLRVQKASTLAPASLNANIVLDSSRLELQGTIRQPLIDRAQLEASIPFELRKVVQSGEIDRNAPIAGRVQIPSARLGVLEGLAPAVRHVSGTGSVDMQISGTLSDPEFGGSANARVDALRLANPEIPVMSGMNLSAGFRDNRLTISESGGAVGGGGLPLRVMYFWRT